MTVDLEKSLKAKLRSIAKEKSRDPADLWQNLILERFLVRLSQSSYKNQFILKGGILLSKYIEIGRETRDLDFLAHKISHEVEKLKIAFQKIISIKLKDGFSFQEIELQELKHPHMHYSGVRASMKVYFGKIRSKITIDIGFGDFVNPIPQTIPLIHHARGPLFESEVKLPCYPKEFIFAEKLETIIYRGGTNSRMKDFHDLHTLLSEGLSFINLGEVIQAVFQHRQTPFVLPLKFMEEEVLLLQKMWSEYLKGLRSQDVQNLPKEIAQVLTRINVWLKANI